MKFSFSNRECLFMHHFNLYMLCITLKKEISGDSTYTSLRSIDFEPSMPITRKSMLNSSFRTEVCIERIVRNSCDIHTDTTRQIYK